MLHLYGGKGCRFKIMYVIGHLKFVLRQFIQTVLYILLKLFQDAVATMKKRIINVLVGISLHNTYIKMKQFTFTRLYFALY